MSKSEIPPGAKDINEVAAEFREADQFTLDDLAVGRKLEIKTHSRTYTLERREDGFYISGHPTFCPEPTKAYIAGSTAGGLAISPGKIIIGGYLEFTTPDRGRPITTSEIEEFQEL